MIEMGGVIQGEVTRFELRIRGVIYYFKKNTLHIFIGI